MIRRIEEYKGHANCCYCYAKAKHLVYEDDIPRNTVCFDHLIGC